MRATSIASSMTRRRRSMYRARAIVPSSFSWRRHSATHAEDLLSDFGLAELLLDGGGLFALPFLPLAIDLIDRRDLIDEGACPRLLRLRTNQARSLQFGSLPGRIILTGPFPLSTVRNFPVPLEVFGLLRPILLKHRIHRSRLIRKSRGFLFCVHFLICPFYFCLAGQSSGQPEGHPPPGKRPTRCSRCCCRCSRCR